ncbi:MAG TPA: exosortase/archaeosortase family protein [Terriglobales bacterium]|nr:exosortase/archaeosortase family protein [Terriglobales bacterium]
MNLASTSNSSRLMQFLLFTLVLAALFYRTLLDLVRLSWNSDLYSHLVVIPVVTGILLYGKRDVISSRGESSARVAAVLAGVTLAVYFLVKQTGILDDPVEMLSAKSLMLVVLWISGFLLFYGVASFKAAQFPLLFMLFAVPVPEPILDPIIIFLQRGSAELTSLLFWMLGVPFLRDGMVFRLPGQAIEIAKECSGIRSSLALMLTTLLAGYLNLRSNTHRILLTAIAIPLAILKNGIRITALTILAVRVDPGFLTGRLHSEGGVVFFVIALLLLGGALRLLQRLEDAPAKPKIPVTMPA